MWSFMNVKVSYAFFPKGPASQATFKLLKKAGNNKDPRILKIIGAGEIRREVRAML